MYISLKQEIFFRYLDIKANSRRAYNGVIGKHPISSINIWRHSSCDNPHYFNNYPLYNPQQISSIWNYQSGYYWHKDRRWRSYNPTTTSVDSLPTPANYNEIQQYLGIIPANASDSAMLNTAYQGYLTNYQQTGLCPVSADLNQLLRLLFIKNELLQPTQLNTCDYPGLALFSVVQTNTPIWQPSVSGQQLTAMLLPDNRIISLTIDTPAFLNWNYDSLLALQNMQVTHVSNDTTYFTMSLWYQHNNQILRTIVQGYTLLPIQNCYFSPVCAFTSPINEIFDIIFNVGRHYYYNNQQNIPLIADLEQLFSHNLAQIHW